MSTTTTAPRRGRPPKKFRTEPIQIRVTEGVARGLEQLAAQNQHTRTQEIVLMIEAALRDAGLLPISPARKRADVLR